MGARRIDGVDAGRRAHVDNTDVRAIRTREKLVTAFHDVVRDVHPNDMSVSALTRAAGVNRTSFYAHFASPEDLAVHALGELFDVVSRADIVRRREHGVTAAEASRIALREIVDFVYARRASYSRLLGPGAPPALAVAISEAFAAPTVESLRRMPARPAAADPRLTAQFLAGGVLNVIGLWLSDPRSRWSRERLVAALVACLPSWIVDDPPVESPVRKPERDVLPAGTRPPEQSKGRN